MAGTEARKTLRQELKEWERAFADANGGRKPTREEIKRDKAIAAKYKEYYKIQPSSKAPKSKSSSHSADPPKHRDPSTKFTTTTPTAIPYCPTNPFASGPSPGSSSARSTATTIPSRPTTSTSVSTTSIFRTPSKPSQQHHSDLYDSPLSTRGRRLFGNRPRDSVGPTPQRTGKVLGIFESFGAAIDTDADTDTDTAAAATPSHKRTLRPSPRKGQAAAASPALSTPRKRKAGEMGTPRTPATQKDVFSTPAFLRRSFIGSLEESPVAAGPRRRPLVKGLSQMVKELRRMEDDAHLDDEEAMREMEREMEGAGADADVGAPVKKRVLEVEAVAAVVVVEENDPETGLPPLPEGAWREERRVEEEESGDEKEDKGRKWKKKGLKRQHRRVIMRPTAKTTTTTTTTTTTAPADDDDAPPPPPPPNPEDAELPGAGYSDEDLSDLDNLPDEPAKAAVPVVAVERKARRISEAAHANYRRVNIRGSKGAKAGAGGGRFRGRRR
ncbi:DNA replication/checkpoint protein [Morchella snyderi]|nr:DNA replication/checkpoint protein [Morchella snyderi]